MNISLNICCSECNLHILALVDIERIKNVVVFMGKFVIMNKQTDYDINNPVNPDMK